MRGAVIVRSHDLVVKETPIPEIGPGDVLVKVKACGVCKTDIHIYEGTFPAALPLIPGHEFSGEVAAVGPGVEGIDVGDKVIVDPNVSCGKCYYCRTARRHFCANWEGMGLTMDGAYAEYVRAPASVVYEMPDGMSFEEGAFTEPVACCVHGIRKLGIGAGDAVAIFGMGPIGLIHAQLAGASGASQVIAVDMVRERLAKAEELGIDAVIDATEADPVEAIRDLTHGLGADAVIEATGNPAVLRRSIQAVGPLGKILVFGVAPQTAETSLRPFDVYRKEITIVGSFTNPYSMEPAIRLISSGTVKVRPLITHRLGIESALRAFEIVKNRLEGVIKVMIRP